MKRIILGIACMLAGYAAGAQSCYPEGVVFSNQGQINGFHAANPGCVNIEGDLTISGYNITDLDGLHGIIQVGGSLRIECNEVLGSLAGLSTLMWIGDNLYVAENLVLPDLTGLDQVFQLGGDLMITANPSLASLHGLEGISSIVKRLYIDDNDALVSLEGLENVSSIGGVVRIISNDALTSLAGLESLASVGGDLSIGGLGHLGSLGNPLLTSIEALSGLTSVGGDIEIGYNASLPSLAGLDNIDPATIASLSIHENNTLSECEVASVCEYLSSPGGLIILENNAPGCNSQEEVQAECLLIAAAEPETACGPVLAPNPAQGMVSLVVPEQMIRGQVEVMDLSGRLLTRARADGYLIRLDVSSFPRGIYLVRVISPHAAWTGRLMRN